MWRSGDTDDNRVAREEASYQAFIKAVTYERD